jgi:hypothetical protein
VGSNDRRFNCRSLDPVLDVSEMGGGEGYEIDEVVGSEQALSCTATKSTYCNLRDVLLNEMRLNGKAFFFFPHLRIGWAFLIGYTT